MIRRALYAAVAAAILVSCGPPPSYEVFHRSDGTGEYAFPIELADTLQAYDISFYTNIDKPLLQRDTLVSFPMQVIWRSPSGRYFSETVYYPAASRKVLYRTGLVPSEEGEWTVSVSINPEPQGFRGLGIVVASR